MAANQALVKKLYTCVIEDVVEAVQESFNDEGVDHSVLMELKKMWENKLAASKVLEPLPDTAETNLCNQLTRTQQPVPSSTRTTAQPTTSGGPARVPTNAPAVPAAATAGKMIKIQITVPARAGADPSTAKSIAVLVPANALQAGTAGAQLRQVLSSASVTAALALPADVATRVLQQHINTALNSAAAQSAPAKSNGVTQVDGPDDSEEEEDIDEDDDDEDDPEEIMRFEEEEEVNDEDPLNSEDDLTDEDPPDLFETDNVVVCQYEKIARTQNRWKFQFKDGLMHINGRDYVFQREHGDAEW